LNRVNRREWFSKFLTGMGAVALIPVHLKRYPTLPCADDDDLHLRPGVADRQGPQFTMSKVPQQSPVSPPGFEEKVMASWFTIDRKGNMRAVVNPFFQMVLIKGSVSDRMPVSTLKCEVLKRVAFSDDRTGEISWTTVLRTPDGNEYAIAEIDSVPAGSGEGIGIQGTSRSEQ